MDKATFESSVCHIFVTGLIISEPDPVSTVDGAHAAGALEIIANFKRDC